MAAIFCKIQPEIKLYLMFVVVFREFDWHVIVVFQRCNIIKMTFKMAAITGRGIT